MIVGAICSGTAGLIALGLDVRSKPTSEPTAEAVPLATDAVTTTFDETGLPPTSVTTIGNALAMPSRMALENPSS